MSLYSSWPSCKIDTYENYSFSSKSDFKLAHDIHVFSTKIREHKTRSDSTNEKPIINQECSEQCPEGLECVYDCSFRCKSKIDIWLNQNNGICDNNIINEDNVDLYCLTFYYDWGDCNNSCPPYYKQDCSGRCFHDSIIEFYLNDLYCSQNDDLKTIHYFPLEPDLNCYSSNDGSIFDYDNGRCSCQNSNELPYAQHKELVLDKNYNCCEKNLIGNNFPDCGEDSLSGCDLSIYEEDGGDCYTKCDKDQVTDCNGKCYDKELIGDGWCHDGRESYIPNFLCEKHNFDNNDCETKPDFIIDYEYFSSVFSIGEVNVPSWYCNPIENAECYDKCINDENCQICTGTNCDFCYIEEGCVKSSGKRKVLKFGTMIANIGTQDFTLGVPPAKKESNHLWQWSECHNHHHFRDYSSYSLLSLPCYEDQGVGFKNGWCVMDLANYPDDGIRCDAKFTCDNQGISKGCSDVYSSNLPCQWIDITDIKDGEYILRVAVNPSNRISELNYDNNTVEVGLRIEGTSVIKLSDEELDTIKSTCKNNHLDLDNNYSVNIVDILILIDKILSPSSTEESERYDVNKDNLVNILDILYLVNTIINE